MQNLLVEVAPHVRRELCKIAAGSKIYFVSRQLRTDMPNTLYSISSHKIHGATLPKIIFSKRCIFFFDKEHALMNTASEGVIKMKLVEVTLPEDIYCINDYKNMFEKYAKDSSNRWIVGHTCEIDHIPIILDGGETLHIDMENYAPFTNENISACDIIDDMGRRSVPQEFLGSIIAEHVLPHQPL